MTSREQPGWLTKMVRGKISPRHRFNARLFWILLRTNGLSGTFKFLQASMRVHKVLGARYGTVIHNLVLCFAGLWNGCRFCGVNHLYTANLDHFDKTGKVLPISESEVFELQRMTYEESMRFVRDRFSSPEYAEHLRVIERLFELYRGHLPETDEDRDLSGAIDVWKWVNECTIQLSYDMPIEEIPPMIDKDPPEDLLLRYHAAREALRTEQVRRSG